MSDFINMDINSLYPYQVLPTANHIDVEFKIIKNRFTSGTSSDTPIYVWSPPELPKHFEDDLFEI